MQKQLRAALMGLQFYATDIAKPKPDVGDIRLGLLSCLEKKNEITLKFLRNVRYSMSGANLFSPLN
jgi:hypothetical protein